MSYPVPTDTAEYLIARWLYQAVQPELPRWVLAYQPCWQPHLGLYVDLMLLQTHQRQRVTIRITFLPDRAQLTLSRRYGRDPAPPASYEYVDPQFQLRLLQRIRQLWEQL